MKATTYPPSMRQLVNELSKLPSIGEKSAVRLAYHLLTRDVPLGARLSEAITAAQERTHLCKICYALTEGELCAICSDSSRNRTSICVVEKPADVIAIERSGGYSGLYHVLHGLWSPVRGVTPEQTKLGALLERLHQSLSSLDTLFPKVTELILGTSTTVEGDATALYIANSVSELELRITRIAQGLPKGGELEYADEVTLSHAFEGRRSLA